MTVPVYNFPGYALQAQSASAAAWASGIAVPVWTQKAAYSFNGSSFTPLTLPAAATDPVISQNATRTGHGYFGVAADGTGGLWMAANYGLLAYLPYPNTSSGFVVDTPANEAIVGLVVTGSASVNNTAVAVDASGNVYITSAANPGALQTLSPGFSTLCKSASVDSINLYTTEPTAGRLGIMNLATQVFSTAATPMSFPGIVSASATGIAVAGWNYASVASGTVSFAASANSPTTLAAFATTTSVALMTGNDPVWAVASVATGLTSVSNIIWNPDGAQILASVSGGVDVIDVVGGNLVVNQNLSVTGSSNMSITTDGSNALVCVPGSNKITVLINSLDIWSVGSSVTLTNPVGVLITDVSTGWAIAGTNAYPLTRAGNIWSAGSPIALGFTGVAIGQDAYGTIYVTGGTGVAGRLAAIVAGVLVLTANWTGVGYGIAMTFELGQVAVLLSDNQTIRVFGVYAGAIAAEGTIVLTAPTGCSSFGATPYSVWLCGSSALWQCQWGKPYDISRYRSGEVSVYNGSSWGSLTLGILHDPSALAWDASGNVWATTVENDLYSISGTVSGGNIAQLSHSVVTDYTGQVPGTILGMSSLTWWNGGLYATTLFPGALVRVY